MPNPPLLGSVGFRQRNELQSLDDWPEALSREFLHPGALAACVFKAEVDLEPVL
jgi:hypothetical protein